MIPCMSLIMFFRAASSITQIEKLHLQVLGRGICFEITFLSESALLRLGHWWLIFNHYKLAHFCFLSDLYWVELLLYLVRKTYLWLFGKVNFSVYSYTGRYFLSTTIFFMFSKILIFFLV